MCKIFTPPNFRLALSGLRNTLVVTDHFLRLVMSPRLGPQHKLTRVFDLKNPSTTSPNPNLTKLKLHLLPPLEKPPCHLANTTAIHTCKRPSPSIKETKIPSMPAQNSTNSQNNPIRTHSTWPLQNHTCMRLCHEPPWTSPFTTKAYSPMLPYSYQNPRQTNTHYAHAATMTKKPQTKPHIHHSKPPTLPNNTKTHPSKPKNPCETQTNKNHH